MTEQWTFPHANCNRCGYTWQLRQKTPKYCPQCKSPYWNREYTPKGIKANKTKRQHK